MDKTEEMTIWGLTLTKSEDGYWLNFSDGKTSSHVNINMTFNKNTLCDQTIRAWAESQIPLEKSIEQNKEEFYWSY